MRDFLSIVNAVGVVISIMLGVAGYYLRWLLPGGYEKIIYLGTLGTCFAVYCLYIENRVLSRLRGDHSIQLRNNPAIGVAFARLGLLLLGGVFLYYRIELLSAKTFLIFSLLVYFFVSGIFGAVRFLRIKR